MIPGSTLNWSAAHSEVPGSRYLAQIFVAGCPMHLEARQVNRDGEEVTFTEYDDEYEAIASLDPEADFFTVTPAAAGIDDPAASGEYLR
jgi:hypothetical protein